MTSAEAIAANRRNARRSTGPRTAAGKRKIAASNALRHGLTAGVAQPATTAAAARIATALAGPGASPERQAFILPIAEAQAELLRIRAARSALINLASGSLHTDGDREADAIMQSLPKLVLLDRYERSAMRRRHRAMQELRKSFTRRSK